MNASAGSRPEPGKRLSIALAVAVHVVLIGLLVYGIRWQTRAPEAVEVSVVQAPPAPPVALPPPAETKAPEPRPAPKVEPKPAPPPPRPDIAVKEKPKPAPKPEPKHEPDKASQKLMAEAMKREQQQLDSLRAERELARMTAAKESSARDKATADYIGRIRGKIKGNLVLPPDIKGNPEAVFEVVQLPSGEILSARLKQPSGHAAYDAAVERAILKSSPLPKPERGEVERNLLLRFRPLEE